MIDWEQEAKYYFFKYHRDVSMLFGQKITDGDLDKKWNQEKKIIKEVYKK